MATKTEPVAGVKTTIPFSLYIENGRIEVKFQASFDTTSDTILEEYLYEGADFAALIIQDVGTLLGGAPVGITLAKLASDLAVRIAVDRGDEDLADWGP